jgi:hypothetical protein
MLKGIFFGYAKPEQKPLLLKKFFLFPQAIYFETSKGKSSIPSP